MISRKFLGIKRRSFDVLISQKITTSLSEKVHSLITHSLGFVKYSVIQGHYTDARVRLHYYYPEPEED